MHSSTRGSFTAVLAALLLAACGGGGGGGSQPPPPAANVSPTANAGPNQTVPAGVIVTLNGTGSSDPDGSIASYAWTQTAGTPAVTLSSTTVAQPTFTAPAVGIATTLSFSLMVTDNRGASSTASTVNVLVSPLANGNVTGRVRFTRIPATANGLNYGNPQLQIARGVVVRAVNAGTQAVLATTSTDSLGSYALNVAPGTSINIVVVAQMVSGSAQVLPRWDFRAQDNEAANPSPYTFTDGQTFSSSAGVPHDIDIPSGFSTTGSVTGTRASAPFAILDTVYRAVELVLSVAPAIEFPPLILDWAADNPGGETFFDGNNPQQIVLSADTTEDTDEYDQHVIAHEFGHYIEFNFSRADNIGGSHGLGDKLDIRVAFGEGFGYAFGAIVLNDPVTRDTFVQGGAQVSSTFNVETNPTTNQPGTPIGNYGCWCSESSVWSILWDIYDNPADGADNLALGFQPIWDVLTGAQRTTRAFTSIFSFTSALKAANAGSVAAIDTLLAAQNISAVADIYGTGETHFPSNVASSAALPIYTNVTVGGPAVQLLNVNDAGHYNTLGNHRFLKFTLPSARTITISVTSSNPDVNADPDFTVFRNGAQLFNVNGEKPPPQPEVVTITNAAAGDYLLDVYDCANGCSADEGTPGDYSLNVTVN